LIPLLAPQFRIPGQATLRLLTLPTLQMTYTTHQVMVIVQVEPGMDGNASSEDLNEVNARGRTSLCYGRIMEDILVGGGYCFDRAHA
jgi:hypothetical protein